MHLFFCPPLQGEAFKLGTTLDRNASFRLFPVLLGRKAIGQIGENLRNIMACVTAYTDFPIMREKHNLADPVTLWK